MSDSNKQKLDSVQAKALRKLISPVAQHVVRLLQRFR